MRKIYTILLLTFATAALAVEDPPNCSLANGGLGNTSHGGINFTFGQAHVGDTVPVFAIIGMVSNACKAINATGSIYIATGFLTNFMINVTLNPATPGGQSSYCPGTNTLCEPGPYNITITAPMVGAGVTSPNGSVGGVAKVVRAVENGVGDVQTGDIPEQLQDFHSASISIVTPCIEVFKICGTNCVGNPVEFTGYVTNCGDITLTNVNVVDDRTAFLFNPDDTPLVQGFTLTNAQVVQFNGSFTPDPSETSTATNTITAWGTDTTTVGGPNASVTNTVTEICSISPCASCVCPCLFAQKQVRERYFAMLRP